MKHLKNRKIFTKINESIPDNDKRDIEDILNIVRDEGATVECNFPDYRYDLVDRDNKKVASIDMFRNTLRHHDPIDNDLFQNITQEAVDRLRAIGYNVKVYYATSPYRNLISVAQPKYAHLDVVYRYRIIVSE